MRSLVLISLVLSVVVGLVAGALDANRQDGLLWKVFKSKFNKIYANSTEDSMRMRIFLGNKRKIEQHNEVGQSSYKMGLNHLSDWTQEELSRFKGPRMDAAKVRAKLDSINSLQQETPESLRRMLEVDLADLPAEVDWRKVPGRVGPIKDQGYCRAAWAFAVTGLLEGQQYKLNLSSVVPLSEQDLIDCSDRNFGCEGGFVDDALADIAKMGGIESEQSYPYKVWAKRHSDQKCTFHKGSSIMSVKGSHLLDATEETLQKVVAQYGPVSIGMDSTDNLIFYEFGVFYDQYCSNNPALMTEQMLVVGYGTDKMQGDYWIVKAAWDDEILDHGYFKLARNKNNLCGIANYATIAIM